MGLILFQDWFWTCCWLHSSNVLLLLFFSVEGLRVNRGGEGVLELFWGAVEVLMSFFTCDFRTAANRFSLSIGAHVYFFFYFWVQDRALLRVKKRFFVLFCALLRARTLVFFFVIFFVKEIVLFFVRENLLRTQLLSNSSACKSHTHIHCHQPLCSAPVRQGFAFFGI